MKTKRFFLILAATLMLPVASYAQEAQALDTVKTNTKEVENRNVMLNASADNQPRQINIGLPSSLSATIYEDGLPVSYNVWPCLPYLYWTGTAQHERMGVMSIGESAITTGAVNYAVLSNTRTGKEVFEGHANYTTNLFGKQTFDVSIAGPIAQGWSYSLGAYINHDPGSNRLADTPYATDMQLIKASLSKIWNDGKGKFNLYYRFAYTKSLSDSYGPFIFVGDGSVEEYNGFDLGRDGFLPANGQITYTDVITGEEKTIVRANDTHAQNQAITANFNYTFDNGLNLNINTKYNYSNANYTTMAVSGVGTSTGDGTYTYLYSGDGHNAGDVYTGEYASRYMLRDIGFERDWLTNFELNGKSSNGAHSWRVGGSFYWNRQGITASTAVLATTVEADPVWLAIGGSQAYATNTGGEFYDSHETKLAFYLSDDWQATERLWLSLGLRAEFYSLGGSNAAAYEYDSDTGEYVALSTTNNERSVGWSLNQDGTMTEFSESWVNPAGEFNFRYTIAQGFGVLGEYVYAMQHPNSQDFAGAYTPILDAVNIHLAHGGIFWNTSWMKLVSQVSFISQSNYKSRTQFTNPDDASDIVTIPLTYDIQTIGWTTDVVITPFKGFMFHGLLTLQAPKYKNFEIDATFQDGSTTHYDFSDNYTTGVSKCLIELDPSYSFSKFRIWASFRYQSKQYINKTNSLYFNGRWETFAGIDYTLNKNVGFSLNFVNLLNETGADGSISAADLLEDVDAYKNYLMTGSYIRPFTVELTTRFNF